MSQTGGLKHGGLNKEFYSFIVLEARSLKKKKSRYQQVWFFLETLRGEFVLCFSQLLANSGHPWLV